MEWVTDDTSRQGVIKATRKPMIGLSRDHWKPDPALYPRWQGIIEEFSGHESIAALVDAGKAAGIPEQVVQTRRGVATANDGGDTSLTVPFPEAVSPEAVIISVRADNRFGHPYEVTLEKLGGIQTYRTDRHGSID